MGSLEGAWFIASVNVSPLSEQQLVDCDLVDSTGNLSGCQLGIPQGGVVDYTDVSTDNEQTMMSAMTQQPVSIDIEIDQYSVQLYSSGMFIASGGSYLDHGVSAVGYRCEAGTDCWKVKNSWGSS